MRLIQLILLIGGYASLLPFNAEWLGALDNTCVVVVYGPIELFSPIVGISLLIGYSNAVAGRVPWNSPRVFWSVSAMFNATISLIAFHNTALSSIPGNIMSVFSALHDSTFPEFQSGYFLEALGGISIFFLLIWMPIAAFLSVIALFLVSRQCSNSGTVEYP